ncbi:MAG: DUF3322 domain-containing protein [Gordonia sp. (in: high G+C Gram-positive bacteria)]
MDRRRRGDGVIPLGAAADAARKAVRNRMRRWLADPDAAASDTLTIALHPPTENTVADDPDAARDWVRAWLAYAGPGVVDREQRRWRSFGEQTVPVRLRLAGAAEICRAAGELPRWQMLVARRAQLLTLASGEVFDDVVAGLHKQWEVLSEVDFERLLATLAWLLANPDSGLLIRQLPIVGVHTKWLARHRTLVEKLIEGARGSRELGVHAAPRLVELALLDPRLRAGLPRLFAAPLSEVAAMAVRPATVLVVENRECLHVLPDAVGTVALLGSGNAVTALGRIGWLGSADVVYWGDLDPSGIAFIGRLRRSLPQLRSVMTDVATFRRWESLSVDGSPLADNTELPLTDPERELLALVAAEGRLLEQERIPWTWARERLVEAGVPFGDA